ncbi:unnamed protein product [Moneuplotes crassus]|uniref:Uncharacterized protein n=1 Tax=Euplotes crassus TaxID=5936 RepID=A0AAD2CZZ6_EUPCR|nr:unnamed protein product [Moneuplotes crassus]
MISKKVPSILKNTVHKFCRVVRLNGKEFHVPIGFEEPEYDIENIQKSSKVILVRHANTVFNLEHDTFIAEHGYARDVLKIQYDEKHRDTPLSEFGIQQAKNASKYAKDLDVDLVLISPLKRTIQTAYYLLRNHPNKEKINYVIHPGIREHLVGVSEMTDNWEDKLVNEYQKYFPNLDSSLMKTKSGYYNELFYCRDIQPELRSQFQGKSKQEIEQLIRASSEERFPKSAEIVEGTYDRVQKVKKYIEKHIKNRLPEDQYKKVLVITHSLLLKVWLGNWSGMERPFTSLPKETRLVKNCEFVADTTYKY